MSLLDQIKIAVAKAALGVEKAFGDTGTYVDSTGTQTTVWLSAGGVNGDGGTILGVRVAEDTRKFWISEQTGFPPDGGPNAKHYVIYRSQYWAVQNVQNPDGIGKRYELDVILTTGLSIQE